MAKVDLEKSVGELEKMFYTQVNMQNWRKKLEKGNTIIAKSRLGACGALQKKEEDFFITLVGEKRRKLGAEEAADFIGTSIQLIEEIRKKPLI